MRLFYVFRAYFWAAYDLCPSLSHEEINCEFQILLNGRNFPVKLEYEWKGSNPVWNCLFQVDSIELDEKLEFASNLII